jgi:hypothetical protein
MATATEFVKSRNVREMTFTLTYEDTTAVKVCSFPAGARVIAVILNVVTAFSGGTTTVDFGTSTDPDAYVDGASVASAGWAAIGTALVSAGPVLTTRIDGYASVGAGNTAGEVRTTVLFSIPEDKAY